MSAKSWLVISAIAAGIGGWMYVNHQKQERANEDRRRFETSRISTADPLLNLAGCMANHLTPLSAMSIGSVIFDTDTRQPINAEEVRQFEDVRDALVKVCAPEYWQPVIARYGSVTVPMLNTAVSQVMREDPKVKAHIGIKQMIHDQLASAYVKK